jgi:hypothetical protein
VTDWTAHPFRRDPQRGVLVLAVIAGIAGALWVATTSVVWALFAALVLLLSLESFYFPTRYHLGAEVVRVSRVFSKSERPWSAFRRVYEDARGLTLSPYARRSMLEPYRALRLLFDGGERDEIVRVVRASVDTNVEWIRGSKPA